MKQCIITAIICLMPIMTYAENIYNVKADVTRELKSFFAAVSEMVDDSDPSDPDKFADSFTGEVFRFNGKKMNLEHFLLSYRDKVMKKERIDHTFYLISLDKKTNAGNVYSVKGLVQRCSPDGTWKSKKEEICLDVVYDSERENENLLQILSVNMDTALIKVYPKTEEKYEFKIDRIPYKYNTVSYNGESFDMYVKSTVTKYLSYEGIESKAIEVSDADFSIQTSSYGISTKNDGTTVHVRIGGNNSHECRTLSLLLKQHNSNKRINVEFKQEKKPKRPFKFTLTERDGWHECYIQYIDKYNYGLSYKASIAGSRWCIGIGLLFAPNYWKGKSSKKDSRSLDDAVYSEGGYTVTKKAYAPGDDDYMEAEPFIGEFDQMNLLNALYMDTGVWLCNYLRVDCGAGWAYYVTRNVFEKANYVEIYEYQKKNNSLPDIPDQVHTYGYVKNYHQEKAKHGLLLKPGFTLSIPLSRSFRVNLSGSYLYSPMIKNMEKKWVFSVGFAWKMD